MHDDEASTTESRGIPRRTIVKGAAWSIPAIAVAVAAPAQAASTPSVPVKLAVSYARVGRAGGGGDAGTVGAGNRLFFDVTIVNNGTSDATDGVIAAIDLDSDTTDPNSISVGSETAGWTESGRSTYMGPAGLTRRVINFISPMPLKVGESRNIRVYFAIAQVVTGTRTMTASIHPSSLTNDDGIDNYGDSQPYTVTT